MGELDLTKPINAAPGDRYASRGGTHNGVDYPAPKGTPVQAAESGEVLRAADNPKTPNRSRSYGNVIVIYHNPGRPDSGKAKNRHLYTLYAHLDEMHVKAGDYVEKYETIGTSGDTGHSTGPHLHFEIIETNKELGWNTEGTMGVDGGLDRVDPERYFNQPTAVEGILPDMAERSIMDRIEFVPNIDLRRIDRFRLEAWLDGKNIGYLNKDNGAIRANIKYDVKKELKKMWGVPLSAQKSAPVFFFDAGLSLKDRRDNNP